MDMGMVELELEKIYSNVLKMIIPEKINKCSKEMR